jgi:hypothetical protein
VRRTVLIAAMSALFLGPAGVVCVSAVSQAAGPNTAVSKTLAFDVRFSPFSPIATNNQRNAGSPVALGDEVVFHDLLFQHGKQVGDDAGSCVVVALTPEVLGNCTAMFRVPGGDISAQLVTGPGSAPKPLVLTGGTGTYVNVGGEGTLVEFGNGRGTLTLQLVRFETQGNRN